MKQILRSVAVAAVFGAATCALALPMMSSAGAAGTTPSSTKLSASPNAPIAGQTVTFSAKIVPGVAGAVPTGTVTFTVDAVAQPPVTVTPSTKTLGDGIATIGETWTAIGSHTVSAHYSGDGTYAASNSAAPVTVSVSPEPTTVAVSSSLSPSIVGQAIKLYAKIGMKYKNPLPTGTVTFTIDGVARPPTPITTGTTHATLPISTLTHGTHNITAHYNGDSAHLASSSAVFVQTVN